MSSSLICPACVGPNPECDTCKGSGEVSQSVVDEFAIRRQNIEAMLVLQNEIQIILADTETVADATTAIRQLLDKNVG